MRNGQHRTIVQLLDFRPQVCRSMDIFLLRLAELVRGSGWQTVHVFSGEPSESFRATLQELESPYYLTEFPINWARARDLARVIRPYRPHIIQTTFMSAFDAPLWWLKRAIQAKYWVVADHSSGTCSPRTGLKRLAAKARGLMADRVIDRVVAISDFVARRDIEQLMFPRKKVRIIHSGVDTQRFHPDGERYPKDGVLTIVFVGQLIPEKGVDLLIEAVGRISNTIDQPFILRIAGAGHQRSALERRAAEVLPGRVEFIGQVEDVPTLLRSADLAVFPSRWEEAFGLVIAEAMACGTPVIVSNAGGIPEVVGGGGRVGLVFRNGDVNDLERQIRFLIAAPELRARMRQAARERAEREFSMERMIEQYASLYEELARGNEG
jgi:glycosyltransferase involved in cell wall biosynthesis